MRIRPIAERDMEDLRAWKNAHKRSFFFQKDITPEMQKSWFEKYKKGDYGRMFVAEEEREGPDGKAWFSFGCLGYRNMNGEIDIFNVIRGETAVSTMREALQLVVKHAKEAYPFDDVTCEVLSDNPALKWYEKQGFIPTSKGQKNDLNYVKLIYRAAH